MDERGLSHEERVFIREEVVKLVEKEGGGPEERRLFGKILGYSPQAIKEWQRRVKAAEPVLKKPGPKKKKPPRAERQKLLDVMKLLGPFAGVPTLRGLFPRIPYRQIGEIKRRVLRVLQRRRRGRGRALRWRRPGSVWAMDFTRPGVRLWEGMNRLLVVRDLGSGASLAVQACRGETAKAVGIMLTALFAAFGAPLVVKFDNGGAFRAHETRALLAEHGVTPLASPPYTPSYNGACERTCGNLKLRAAHAAQLAGRSDHWLPQDLESAVHLANTTARPFGACGPTPAQAFSSRRAVDDEERRAFKRSLQLEIEAAQKTSKLDCGRMPTCLEQAAIDRKAMQSVLCRLGYLAVRRGRLSTPISAWRALADA